LSAHQIRPCENCPYRKDAKVLYWDKAEFEGVLEAEHRQLGAIFACHKTGKLEPSARGMCAGWLLDQKKRNVPSIMLRLKLNRDDAALEAYNNVTDGGHPMYLSVEAMCRANGVRPRKRR
jgi:hypothetical protein